VGQNRGPVKQDFPPLAPPRRDRGRSGRRDAKGRHPRCPNMTRRSLPCGLSSTRRPDRWEQPRLGRAGRRSERLRARPPGPGARPRAPRIPLEMATYTDGHVFGRNQRAADDAHDATPPARCVALPRAATNGHWKALGHETPSPNCLASEARSKAPPRRLRRRGSRFPGRLRGRGLPGAWRLGRSC